VLRRHALYPTEGGPLDLNFGCAVLRNLKGGPFEIALGKYLLSALSARVPHPLCISKGGGSEMVESRTGGKGTAEQIIVR